MAKIKKVFGRPLSEKPRSKVDCRWQKDPRDFLSEEMKMDYRKNYIAENISVIQKMAKLNKQQEEDAKRPNSQNMRTFEVSFNDNNKDLFVKAQNQDMKAPLAEAYSR